MINEVIEACTKTS